ncbi:MAG: lipopolysaccharide biosynthesis protein, partial [Flammeovirgaceae bacterium]
MSSALINFIFYKKYPQLFPPKFNIRDFAVGREMVPLGFKFFVIQTYLLMLSFSDNYFILKYVGEKAVTEYSLIFRLFNTVILVYSYFANTLWTYFSEAYHKGELIWIKEAFKKMRQLILIFIAAMLVIWAFCEPVVRFWVGDENVNVSYRLAFLVFLFHVVYMWNFTYSLFLYSISALKLDFNYATIAIFTKVVLTVFFL